MAAVAGRKRPHDRGWPLGASPWAATIAGTLLVVHFLIVVIVKLSQSVGEEVLWTSHVALLIAGIGLVRRDRLLVGTAFAVVLPLHAVWLGDAAGLWLSGRSPLGITHYLATADGPTWLATAHHFYLTPLLWCLTARWDLWDPRAPFAAAGIMLQLTVVARALLPAGRNINYSYQVLPAADLGLLESINGLPVPAYLLILNLGTAALIVAGYALARRVASLRRRAGS